MTPELGASRSLYSQIHSYSNAFSQGWIRGDVVTVTRSVRDIDDDKSRLFTETYHAPASAAKEKSLLPVRGNNFEVIRPVFQDISPSGKLTLSLRQGGKNDEVPLISVYGDQISHHLDVSDYHGKFVGDSWFGGVSWSDDERFVAYVAFKKDDVEKKVESSKYFEYRSSEPNVNKFEYVDDWGEKYVGLVSLSLNILNTETGEVSTVEGTDDTMWTVGQPVFLPTFVDATVGKKAAIKSENKNPSYRLAYTSWRNGPKKLGMIYCYQRESSIFVVDLTDILVVQNKAPLEFTPTNSDKVPGSEVHVLVTPGIKLARSARFSPNGAKMVFLGSKKGFPSHSGCSELLSVDVSDIVLSLADAKKREQEKKVSTVGDESKEERQSTGDILITTVVPSISGKSITGIETENNFPGIYTDQLPRNCFISDDCVVMTTPWGSVETIIAVELLTKTIQKIEIPLANVAPENLSKISSSILDIQRMPKADDDGDAVYENMILLSVSTPTSSQVVALMDVCVHANKKDAKINIVTSLCTPPTHYLPDQIPISRKKPTKKVLDQKSLVDKSVENVIEKSATSRAIKLKNILMGGTNFNSLLDWKTTRYYDENNVPYESILITPKQTENGVLGFESLGGSRKCPLIVVPHGGPHSCMTTTYVASYAFLALQLGAAILHVNYRGSTGFGQDSIEALLGQIGIVDVADMVHCTQDSLLKNPTLDPDRVAVVGGSHGGFLAAHLVGQYPDLFKVACMRNPVTDIPSMLSVTDIPDWCYVEALGAKGALKYSKNSRNEDDFNTMPDEKDLLKMRECSPIIYAKNVRAPVLMLIGGKDRRVPMSQGVSYYHNLKAKGVMTKLLVFPEDVHAIDRPLSEAEQWIAAADWLETYLL